MSLVGELLRAWQNLRRMVWLSASLHRAQNPPPATADTAAPIWCVVANIVLVRSYGPGGIEKRPGTKLFAPGGKAYVIGFFWGGGGETVTVVARHRKSKRYVTASMPSAHLANWRAELVYSPHVIRQIEKHGDIPKHARDSAEAKDRAEKIAASYIAHGAPSQPFVTRGTTPKE
ncbi:hypothetical protein [Tahibacter amnicola]|uniref:Uncharacterized protein n=1 Tax=Tahibacter amnicola TaxID=2976241 RepID=A0ABY6BAQ6_9GAMM|nr:hypothetical protein [Tahibacter amnicola]UXI67143.1 hypothetical protein N4264_20715 [Tahibacter amnicola]